MSTCTACGNGTLKRDSRYVEYKYKNRTINVLQPGEYCSSCDESFLTSADMAATRKEIHDLHAIEDHYLQSDEVRHIRESLSLTQADAAEIFGGGPNAFSRYENGITLQSKATDKLLRLLALYPSLLGTIRSIQSSEAFLPSDPIDTSAMLRMTNRIKNCLSSWGTVALIDYINQPKHYSTTPNIWSYISSSTSHCHPVKIYKTGRNEKLRYETNIRTSEAHFRRTASSREILLESNLDTEN